MADAVIGAASEYWAAAPADDADTSTVLTPRRRHQALVSLAGVDLGSAERAVPPHALARVHFEGPSSIARTGASVMPWTARFVLAAVIVYAARPTHAVAQAEPSTHRHRDRGSGHGAGADDDGGRSRTPRERRDRRPLFLRLAGIGPGMVTAGDRGFIPLLARSWSRRDSLTLVFELDPRARWHDGAPVTAPRRGLHLQARARPRNRAPPRRRRHDASRA